MKNALTTREVNMASETYCWSLIIEAIRERADPSTSLQIRAQSVVDALHSLALARNSSKFLNLVLATSGNNEAIRAAEEDINRSISLIADLVSETGMATSSARAYAADWVATLQGALILLAFVGETGPLMRTMQCLLDLTNAPVEPAK